MNVLKQRERVGRPMKLAVNYSTASAELAAAGRLGIDLLKTFDDPALVARSQAVWPTYVHFSCCAGGGGIDRARLDAMAGLLESTGTPYASMHLAPKVSDFRGMAVDTRRPADAERLRTAMRRDIDAVVGRFGAERVILENTMWNPVEPYVFPRPVLEPDFIRELVHETGCGFLLDVAHAGITAKYFGVDEHAYIEQLPVDRLCEIHVAGVEQQAEQLWVDHLPMTDGDWRLVEWVLGQVRAGRWPAPWAVTLEYGGVGPGYEEHTDRGQLLEQVPRLLARVRSATPGESR